MEIDPNEYEEDESKFAALKDSNDVRMEIFKDILLNRLDIECDATTQKENYTPGYFLGRHEVSLYTIFSCYHN